MQLVAMGVLGLVWVMLASPVVFATTNEPMMHRKLLNRFLVNYQFALQRDLSNFDGNASSPAQQALNRHHPNFQHKHHSSNNNNNSNAFTPNEFFVKKTIFDDRTRVLFVAGIEGSGHHAIKDVLELCFSMRLCRAAPFSKDLFYRGSGSQGLFGAANYSSHPDLLEVTLGRMKEFVFNVSHNLPIEDNTAYDKRKVVLPGHFGPENESTPPPHIYVIGLETFPSAGMMSYPNFNDGQTKALDHPDLIPLAILAEEAGIDLRILVLSRPAYDTLYSVIRRGYGNGYGPEILVDNAIALTHQIQMIDPAFFLCLPYEKLASYSHPEQAADLRVIAQFLHPVLDEESLQIMLKMWTKIHPVHHDSNNDIHPSGSATKNLRGRPEANLDVGNEERLRRSKRLLRSVNSSGGRRLTPIPLAEVQFLMKTATYDLWRLNITISRLRSTCSLQ